ncbi:hypothetical protein H4R33_006574, partial [Dimargaris cristalligena]
MAIMRVGVLFALMLSVANGMGNGGDGSTKSVQFNNKLQVALFHKDVNVDTHLSPDEIDAPWAESDEKSDQHKANSGWNSRANSNGWDTTTISRDAGTEFGDPPKDTAAGPSNK